MRRQYAHSVTLSHATPTRQTHRHKQRAAQQRRRHLHGAHESRIVRLPGGHHAAEVETGGSDEGDARHQRVERGAQTRPVLREKQPVDCSQTTRTRDRKTNLDENPINAKENARMHIAGTQSANKETGRKIHTHSKGRADGLQPPEHGRIPRQVAGEAVERERQHLEKVKRETDRGLRRRRRGVLGQYIWRASEVNAFQA